MPVGDEAAPDKAAVQQHRVGQHNLHESSDIFAWVIRLKWPVMNRLSHSSSLRLRFVDVFEDLPVILESGSVFGGGSERLKDF